MADDLIVISWNVLKKTRSAFEKRGDTASLLAKGIAKTVAKFGRRGIETPFVTYLSEIKGSKQDVKYMRDELVYAYWQRTHQDINGKAIDLGGETHTREWMIVLWEGVSVVNHELDIRTELSPAIEQDRNQARQRLLNPIERRSARIRKAGSPYQAKEKYYRRNVKEVGWFRNGVISDIRLGNTRLRVSSAHAPGPDHVKDFPESVDAALSSAYKEGADLFVGDLNRRGQFGSGHFLDLRKGDPTGTTFKKKALEGGQLTLGKNHRDRLMEIEHYSRWNFTSYEPQIVGRGAFDEQLTDHALMVVGATPRGAEEERSQLYNLVPDRNFWSDMGWQVPEGLGDEDEHWYGEEERKNEPVDPLWTGRNDSMRINEPMLLSDSFFAQSSEPAQSSPFTNSDPAELSALLPSAPATIPGDPMITDTNPEDLFLQLPTAPTTAPGNVFENSGSSQMEGSGALEMG